MYLSLRSKTIVGIALIEALLLLLLIYTATSFMRQTVNEELVRFARTTANLFATTTKDAVLSYDLASLEAFVAELLANPDVRYARVLGPQGGVFAEGGDPTLLAKTFNADDTVALVDDNIFDAFALIKEGDAQFGRIEIGIDINALQRTMQKFQNTTSVIAATEMALVALFSFVLGSYLTRQLKTLRTGAKHIAGSLKSGQFQNIKVSVSGRDELAEVATAFNTLVDNLAVEHEQREAYQRDLEELNQTLEQKVASRTAQLARKNTELQDTNRELKTAQQQLLQAEKMASVGQLAAGVAHEINNPIGFVTSNLASLQEYVEIYQHIGSACAELLNCKDTATRETLAVNLSAFLEQNDLAFVTEDINDLLSESSEGLLRVKDIVQGLKQFSRADSDDLEQTDLNECVKTTLNMVSNELKYHCDITSEFGQIPQVYLNIGKINQVLTNLLINAGQAIDENGKIKIKTGLKDGYAFVSITDNGCGIEPEHIKQLFDPFFTTKAEGEGTGLGLAISYGIMQDHGGDILVSSKPGTGTCFVLRLPIQRDAQDTQSGTKEVANES